VSWEGLAPMATIDVVVDAIRVPAVRSLIKAGATGWTGVPGVSGSVTTATTRVGK
jgi:hypothetical protein